MKEKDIILYYLLKYWGVTIAIISLPFIIQIVSLGLKIYLIGVLINTIILNIYSINHKNLFFDTCSSISENLKNIMAIIFLISLSVVSLIIGLIAWLDN